DAAKNFLVDNVSLINSNERLNALEKENLLIINSLIYNSMNNHCTSNVNAAARVRDDYTPGGTIFGLLVGGYIGTQVG
ncbi:hypothetical protein ABK046_52550, partial [Streptomyces caeruleatus]